MKYRIIIMTLVVLIPIFVACSSEQQKSKGSNIEPSNVNKQVMSLPVEYVDDLPEGTAHYRTFIRYCELIIEPISGYRKVTGTMPKSLDEFFNSDFCFVHPRERETGLLFQESDTLDVNHPEYIIYKHIDEDTAKISFILKTVDGQPFIYTHEWNREKGWAFYPRDAQGQDFEEWQKRVKTKPPVTTKKAKVMLELFSVIFDHAVQEYFDKNNSFPESLNALFSEWGDFRKEPWKNYAYDDPVKKLPNMIFGFDKNQNYLYRHSFWEDSENEYALKLPANSIEEVGRPINMQTMSRIVSNGKVIREEGNINSLNIQKFIDIEMLKNL